MSEKGKIIIGILTAIFTGVVMLLIEYKVFIPITKRTETFETQNKIDNIKPVSVYDTIYYPEDLAKRIINSFKTNNIESFISLFHGKYDYNFELSLNNPRMPKEWNPSIIKEMREDEIFIAKLELITKK